MRLAMHFCDDSEEAKRERIEAGKKHIECKSKEEIIDFFSNNIMSLDVMSQQPDLTMPSQDVL